MSSYHQLKYICIPLSTKEIPQNYTHVTQYIHATKINKCDENIYTYVKYMHATKMNFSGISTLYIQQYIIP